MKINEKGHLVIGEVDAVELAEKYDTPLYVIDENKIRENYRRIYNAFKKDMTNLRSFMHVKQILILQ